MNMCLYQANRATWEQPENGLAKQLTLKNKKRLYLPIKHK